MRLARIGLAVHPTDRDSNQIETHYFYTRALHSKANDNGNGNGYNNGLSKCKHQAANITAPGGQGRAVAAAAR